MKHRIRRGSLVALIAGITFFYPLLAPTPHRIDETHFSLVEKGMSRAEIEAIFGVPPGEYDWAEGQPITSWYTLYAVTGLRTVGSTATVVELQSLDVTLGSEAWPYTPAVFSELHLNVDHLNTCTIRPASSEIDY